ncbi:MAG: CDP-diacylglycerol--glycerol-3-phosphate 3-phosphatidyltransferase [Verrucomicrobia bacterium]|nr:CDP-diacylglycerol--glycerol-3-phosphate 3-phosphatidyltransferase [Verrucomicrobiota bacterium]
MTTANKITIIRILLVPLFITQVIYYVQAGVEYHRWLALAAFGVAAISDGIDGYIARRYNQRSELGAILDPLADKLLLVSGVILLSFRNDPHLPQLPLWLVATILSRDVLLLIGLAVIYYTCGRVMVQPVWLGKIATVLQMACVVWGLLKLGPVGLLIGSAGAAVFTGVSGLIYVFDGVRQLSASPTSGPAPRQ